jgi:hypothetical protein
MKTVQQVAVKFNVGARTLYRAEGHAPLWQEGSTVSEQQKAAASKRRVSRRFVHGFHGSLTG